MNARVLSTVLFDEKLLSQELNKILKTNFSSNYSEFAIGEWKTCVLWNETGCQDDTTAREYLGSSKPTEIGKKLNYIHSIVRRTFNVEYIKWIRIFSVKQGLIIPHKDYLEMENGFTRVHIPIQTDLTCLHSEEDKVYHMRKGEGSALM